MAQDPIDVARCLLRVHRNVHHPDVRRWCRGSSRPVQGYQRRLTIDFMGMGYWCYAGCLRRRQVWSPSQPAVTFSSCVFRKFPWKSSRFTRLAQTLGAFCAAGVVYANYKSAIDVFEGGAGIRTVGRSQLDSRNLLHISCRVHDADGHVLLRIHR